LRLSRVSKTMTDAFQVAGAFAPAETMTENQPSVDTAGNTTGVGVEETAAETAAPNGFVTMGLALELVHAVRDLGYTQPTSVQLKTIPLALPGESDGKTAAKYIDLMVSSQTGSGKTAAFLLPVLHTLLKQQAKAEADERAAFEREVAEAVARGEAPPKRAKRKDPTNPRNFKAPAPGALVVVPDPRTGPAGGQRRHRPGATLPWFAHRQHGGRHALPVADCQTAKRQPGGGHARPAAGPAAFHANQARSGAVPGRGRGRPHARSRLFRRPGRSQPAHH
jgi:hypothetical protein